MSQADPGTIPDAARRHRADIDGLRAIAVAGVVAFHAFPALLPGGFVGVDVFFVISGFLITQIVRGETMAGAFSIGRFYERRIRRIFPALALVVAVTSLVGLAILAPEDLKAYGRSLPPSIAFAANFHFWTRGSYFNPPQDVRPLLHLWSLGVEEQFYIVWPPMLILARRWSAPALGGMLVALVAISLAADQIFLSHDVLAAFYATPLRAWEPLIGAFLASGWIDPPRSARASQRLALAGLAAILGSMALLSEKIVFPGLAAAPACLGAALILQAGRGAAETAVARLLALGPMVWFGGISYSLYLWHWPVLTFLRLGAPNEPPAPVMACGVAASILLAVLSTRFVEQRFRRRPKTGLSRRGLFAVTAVAISALALSGSVLASHEGLQDRAGPFARQTMAAEHDLSTLWKTCHAKSHPAPDACLFGAGHPGPPQLLLWGDSMAASWAEPVALWAGAHGLKGRLTTLAGCLPSLDIDVHEREGTVTPCRARNADLVHWVKTSPQLKMVVLAARWPMYDKGTGPVEGVWDYITRPGEPRRPSAYHALVAEGLERLITSLSRDGPSGLKIVIIGPSPEFAVNPDRCAQRATFVGKDPWACLSESAADFETRQAGSVAILRAVAARHPNVTLVLPNSLFCDAAQCHAVLGGHMGFIDGDHLTATVARALGPSLTQNWPVPDRP